MCALAQNVPTQISNAICLDLVKLGKMATSQLLTSWKSRIQTLSNDRPLYTRHSVLIHF